MVTAVSQVPQVTYLHSKDEKPSVKTPRTKDLESLFPKKLLMAVGGASKLIKWGKCPYVPRMAIEADTEKEPYDLNEPCLRWGQDKYGFPFIIAAIPGHAPIVFYSYNLITYRKSHIYFHIPETHPKYGRVVYGHKDSLPDEHPHPPVKESIEGSPTKFHLDNLTEIEYWSVKHKNDTQTITKASLAFLSLFGTGSPIKLPLISTKMNPSGEPILESSILPWSPLYKQRV